MKVTILGTGNAQVTNCYNTCFVLEENEKCMLVDGGGGNELLRRLKQAGYRWQDMRDIFVTHKHIDHTLGIVWMLRLILQGMSRGQVEGEYTLYGHDEVIELVRRLADLLLEKKETQFIGTRFHLVTLEDGDTKEILGREFRFFDLHSTKAKQYGFTVRSESGKLLSCCGDEPCPESAYPLIANSDLLLHESFCLYADRETYQPYKKSHTTVKDACEMAEKLGVKQLVLYHTEDHDIPNRKEKYSAEGREYFHGELFVPDDMETFEL